MGDKINDADNSCVSYEEVKDILVNSIVFDDKERLTVADEIEKAFWNYRGNCERTINLLRSLDECTPKDISDLILLEGYLRDLAVATSNFNTSVQNAILKYYQARAEFLQPLFKARADVARLLVEKA